MFALLSDSLVRVGNYTAFAAQTISHLPTTILRPAAWYEQLYRIFLGSLPVAAVAGAALGVVAWLQIRGLLFTFQSVSLLPSALAVAVVWEFGPVSAGLIAAGRIGAGLGAELGSLRITEQLDALRVLAISPVQRLVAPRVFACMLALPLLTIFIDYVAILSSFLAEWTGGSMTWTEYRLQCLRYLRMRDALPATLKTVVFGFLVGNTGCYCGSEARGGTEGVGRAATQAVVLATLLVILSDILLVKLTQLFVTPP